MLKRIQNLSLLSLFSLFILNSGYAEDPSHSSDEDSSPKRPPIGGGESKFNVPVEIAQILKCPSPHSVAFLGRRPGVILKQIESVLSQSRAQMNSTTGVNVLAEIKAQQTSLTEGINQEVAKFRAQLVSLDEGAKNSPVAFNALVNSVRELAILNMESVNKCPKEKRTEADSLGKYLDKCGLSPNKDKIEKLKTNFKSTFDQVYSVYNTTKRKELCSAQKPNPNAMKYPRAEVFRGPVPKEICIEGTHQCFNGPADGIRDEMLLPPGVVRSPYYPYKEFNVEGFSPGDLLRDPQTGFPFKVPK